MKLITGFKLLTFVTFTALADTLNGYQRRAGTYV